MGFPILVRCHLYIELGPSWFDQKFILQACSNSIQTTIYVSLWKEFCHLPNIAFPSTQKIQFHIGFMSSYFKSWVNTLRPRQHGRHFADDTLKRIFFNENDIISIKISLKFVPKGPINNIPALVQIMAWRRPGDKPLSEPMAVSLLTHICITRPQWVKWKTAGTPVHQQCCAKPSKCCNNMCYSYLWNFNPIC